MERMYEIQFERIEDGSVRLEQPAGCEDPSVIWLHPEQLKFITRRVCGMEGSTAASVADLERKLSVLAAGLANFVCDSSIRGEIIKYCGDGLELLARLDGLLNLAFEYDGGRLAPEDLDPPGKPVYGPPTTARSTTTISNDGEQLALV